MTIHEFTCADCGQRKSHDDGGCDTTGYAVRDNRDKVCYGCCAIEDRKYMIEHGRNTLYLVKNDAEQYEITNWPGTLRFRVGTMRKGYHNMAGCRYDVWFVGPDGKTWHGVQYGNNTQICRVKRTKAA